MTKHDITTDADMIGKVFRWMTGGVTTSYQAVIDHTDGRILWQGRRVGSARKALESLQNHINKTGVRPATVIDSRRCEWSWNSTTGKWETRDGV